LVGIADKLTPAAFEKHSGKETAGKWRNSVWVMVEGEKVPLSKTVLLKYYYLARKSGSGGGGGCGRRNGRPSHRDEFVCCTRCGKGRRFRLRSKEECRAYHDALAKAHWTCTDLTNDGYVSLATLFFHSISNLPKKNELIFLRKTKKTLGKIEF
jgi:hypothetical protein